MSNPIQVFDGTGKKPPTIIEIGARCLYGGISGMPGSNKEAGTVVIKSPKEPTVKSIRHLQQMLSEGKTPLTKLVLNNIECDQRLIVEIVESVENETQVFTIECEPYE